MVALSFVNGLKLIGEVHLLDFVATEGIEVPLF